MTDFHTSAPTEPPLNGMPVELLYEKHQRLLMSIAVVRFGLTEGDAEAILHDVFLSLLTRIEEVRDIRSWLVGAVCNASRAYRRNMGRWTGIGDAETIGTPDHAEQLEAQVVTGQALTAIDGRSAEILRLRFLHGYTVAEIADRLRTTPKYADKLLRKALLLAQGVLEERVTQ